MTRLLAAIVVIELLVGLGLVVGRLMRPVPPTPDLALVDAIAASQLRDRARSVRTPQDWRDLGEAYMAVGYFSEAEACHRIAVERQPDSATNVREWAFALERLGQMSDAVREYRRAERMYHPNSVEAGECRYFAGRCRLREEDPAGAQAEFEAAGSIHMPRYELARLHFREGRLDVAKQILNELRVTIFHTIQPATLFHRIAHQEGNRAAALRFADEAEWARRLPNPFDRDATRLTTAHARLGQHGRWKDAARLIEAGNVGEAESLLRDTLIAGWHPTGADLLAEVALDRGRTEEGIRLLEELVARDGPTTHNLARLGDALAEAGRSADARATWLRSVELGGIIETKDTHYRLAEGYEKSGDAERHRRHQARALLGAGVERLRAASADEARFLLKSAVEADPSLAAGWFYLGETFRTAGQLDDARRAYQQCLTVEPSHGRAATAMELLDGRKP